MPALYAHLRFGEEVLRYLPSPFPALIRQYPEAFAIGTQGPDICFYYRPFRKNDIRANGTRLHALSGQQFFAAQAKKLFSKTKTTDIHAIFRNDGAYAAYLCGALCHFVLDVACHPFIDRNACKEFSHGKMESEFEKFLLRKVGLPIRGYHTATPILCKNGAPQAAAYALDISAKDAQRAMRTMRKINNLFTHPLEGVHTFCHCILSIVGKEHSLGDMFLHSQNDECADVSNATLWDKYCTALPLAADLIQAFFLHLPTLAQGGSIPDPLLRYDFSGTLKEKEIQSADFTMPLRPSQSFAAHSMPARPIDGIFMPPPDLPPTPHPSLRQTNDASLPDTDRPKPTPHPSIAHSSATDPDQKQSNR